MKEKKLISRNMNKKLKPGGIVVFNLPAGISCGQVCPGCYAMKAQKMYKQSRAKRLWNMTETVKKDFVQRFEAELNTGHCKNNEIVRFHEAGEFYSQAYVNKVATIVEDCPSKTFYAYTKRMKDFDFTHLKSLSNMVLLDSAQFGPINYYPADEIDAAETRTGAYVCPAGDNITCNVGCNYCFDVDNKEEVQKRGIIFKKH